MAVVLTDAQLDYFVKSASWKFDVDFKDGRDPVVYTGDGVDDLNALIEHIESSLSIPKIFADVGSLFSRYVIVTIEDIYALRSRYIAFWGTVSKPPFWEPKRGNGYAVEL